MQLFGTKASHALHQQIHFEANRYLALLQRYFDSNKYIYLVQSGVFYSVDSELKRSTAHGQDFITGRLGNMKIYSSCNQFFSSAMCTPKKRYAYHFLVISNSIMFTLDM